MSACAMIDGMLTALSHALTGTPRFDIRKTPSPVQLAARADGARMAETGRYRSQNPLRVTRIEALAYVYGLRLEANTETAFREKFLP